MAVELHLKKSDKSPWGFRLAGGADFDVPLTVIKVTPGSIAENAGMQAGDVVVRANDTPISSLTHAQAHDVIVNSGNDFVIAVRRGDLSHLPPRLLLYETDVENNINPKAAQQLDDADLNITDEEIATIIGDHVQSSQKKETRNVQITGEVNEERREESVKASQATSIRQSAVAKVIADEEQQHSERKWSTFLQKPKNTKPKPKPKEAEELQAPPYRVIIKKQPKKGQVPPKKSTKVDDVNNNESEEEVETITDTKNQESPLEIKDSDSIEEQEISEISEEIVQEERVLLEEIRQEYREEYKKEYEQEEEEEQELIKQSQSEKKLSINLEEQLAEVQKQLLVLSKLPSAIQQTLNAVTRQLSELVAASQQDISIETKVRIEEEESYEVQEQADSDEYREQALSILEEASCEEEETGQVTFEEAVRTESEDEQALFEALERECEQSEMESQIMTEEELEAHQLEQERLEQERLEKKEKDRRRGSSSQPLTPMPRPIILPGGRKWCAPNDVESKLRKPSLTDERIAKTINSYSEVISGRAMGINFLKYQPPPKNLDYLQKSAVYRLIHDIEPPARGIIARDVKVLAEQDYHSKVEKEDCAAQAQLER